jgi:predicted nucleic acid-binding protein
MIYLIDTDVMVDFFNRKRPAQELITTLSKTAILALSALTVAELRSGWTTEQAEYLLPRLFALCDVIPVTREIAEQAGAWRQEYKRRGVKPWHRGYRHCRHGGPAGLHTDDKQHQGLPDARASIIRPP